MTYTVHQAKTNLSKLLKEAEAGQEVIITRGKTPVAKLVAITDARPEQARGQDSPAPAHLEPLTDEELRELGLE
jgi:prevent-host-death family protein